MILKNAFNIMIGNFVSAYKVLIYRIIVGVLVFALSYALVLPNLTSIINSPEIASVIDLIKECFVMLTSAQDVSSYGEKFGEAIRAVYAMLQARIGEVWWSASWAVVLLIVSSYLNGLSNFALGGVINDHMTSFTHRGFMNSLTRNFWRALLYQLIYLFISIVYTGVIVVIDALILVYWMKLFGIFAIVLAIAFSIVAVSIRLTLVCNIMPEMIVNGSGFFKAFVMSLKLPKEYFLRVFSTYFVTCLGILYINLSMAVFTLITGLIFTVPLSYLCLVCIQFVIYYTINKRKYYLTHSDIVVPDGDEPINGTEEEN